METRGWYTEFARYFQNCDDWQSRGYSDYEDCMCNENNLDCPDCTDCSNWQECGYESYEDCQCQQYGECGGGD